MFCECQGRAEEMFDMLSTALANRSDQWDTSYAEHLRDRNRGICVQ